MNIPAKDRLHTLDDNYFYEVYPCIYDAGMFIWALYRNTSDADVCVCVHCSSHTLTPNADAKAYWEEHKAVLLAR